MKRVLFFLAVSILLASLSGAAFSQELVIFTNDTAMSVKSHSEKGGYIYLTLQEGQIAVPRGRVKEIIKSDFSKGGSSPQHAQQIRQPAPEQDDNKLPGDDGSKHGYRKPMGRPPLSVRARSRQVDEAGTPDDDDEEDDLDAEGDDEDDEQAELNETPGTVPPPPQTPKTPLSMVPAGRKR